MRAKFIHESIGDILTPKSKESIVDALNELKAQYRIFKYSPKHSNPGPGRIIEDKFWESFPGMVDAGPNFYYSKSDNTDMVSKNVMYAPLKTAYGIETWNTNKLFGNVINVPFEMKWVDFKGRVNSLFVLLKEQKIILQYYRRKNGSTTGTDPDMIYFDLDHLIENF